MEYLEMESDYFASKPNSTRKLARERDSWTLLVVKTTAGTAEGRWRKKKKKSSCG